MGEPAKKIQPAPAAPANAAGPGNTRQLKRGQLLFAEGEMSRAMYLLKSGMIRIFKKKGDADIEIDTIRSGQILGELAFLDGNPRSASGEALSDCTLVEISGPVFEKTLGEIPDWLKILLKTIVMRLRAASTKIRQLETASTSIDYNSDGKRTSQFVFISPIDAMKIATGLLLVGSRGGPEVQMQVLQRYVNQVMGVPAAKISPFLELLVSTGTITFTERDGSTQTMIQDLDFLDKLVNYLNEENMAEPSKRRDISPKGFFVMSLIAKHIASFAKNAEGIAQVNLGMIKSAETGTNGKDPFRVDELEELVKLRYITVPNMKSSSEILTEIKVDSFVQNYRFQRVVMGIQALNEQKRKVGKS